MYPPKELPNAKILIAVKTYPRPTPSYEEIVCTAGLLESGQWVRIYPIPFRDLPYDQQFKKFNWIQLDLIKSESDFRKESYRPKQMFDEEIKTLEHVGTKNEWLERKRLILNEVFSSMDNLISLAYSEEKSLAILKPLDIIGFEIEEEKEREWKKKYKDRLAQMKLFGPSEKRAIIKKLPYKYYYRFTTEDNKPRRLRILDWEIGALFWNCLKQTEGDEIAANQLVQQKYFEEFITKRDVYLFLGTTYQHHKKKVQNPFTIIGVFAPPQTSQISMQF